MASPSHHQDFMQLAIESAQRAETLFGAAIAMGNDMIAASPNKVKENYDPTAHAEVEVLREAARMTHNPDLSGYTLYTTVEPCPMCASACVWSNIEAIFYGLSIDEVSEYLPQINIPSSDIIAAGFNNIEVHPGMLHDQCLSHLKSFI